MSSTLDVVQRTAVEFNYALDEHVIINQTKYFGEETLRQSVVNNNNRRMLDQTQTAENLVTNFCCDCEEI